MQEGKEAGSYWARTTRLMAVTIFIWAILGFGVHFFAVELNKITILGFPLGFYLAAQGALIGFVVLIFWFSRKQEQIDAEFSAKKGE